MNAVDKAKELCQNAGNKVSDHFADVSKTIPMPKGAEKEFDSIRIKSKSPSTATAGTWCRSLNKF